ncbi:hypothetical protein NKJ26_26710 [Mesorhizobium sp. M0152]|uniref:hypothetical protein n=1 Tax=Mesorhizobium sp. M0152 TaxID=2956898 RepID=UPI0033392939
MDTGLRERLSTANVMQTETDGAIAEMVARKLVVRLDARLIGLPLHICQCPRRPRFQEAISTDVSRP